MRPSPRLAAGFSGFLAVFAFGIVLQASPDEAGTPDRDPETAGETADLPAWQEGDCRESFEVRLWPPRTLLWLERENLRDRIGDPALPESERAKLKQLLGISHRWRMHSGSGNDHLN